MPPKTKKGIAPLNLANQNRPDNTGTNGLLNGIQRINIEGTPLPDENIQFSQNVRSNNAQHWEDFEKIAELGVGNGGVVTKVREKKSGKVRAHKLIRLEVKKEIHRRILIELQLLEKCKHENIVGYYGSFHAAHQNEIVISMEHMNGRSLDVVLHTAGRLPERCVGNICISVLNGLIYLHEEKKVMHRDIKPSNILVNSDGKIKLCDFGVSANLINSIANSFVGTRSYMAPERLQGLSKYTINSDVWAFGVTVIELAIGFYPIPSQSEKAIKDHIMNCPVLNANTRDSFTTSYEVLEEIKKNHGGTFASGIEPTKKMSIFELLEYIVAQEPPRLYPIEDNISKDFADFVNSCLNKGMNERPTFNALKSSNFIQHVQNNLKNESAYFAMYMKYVIEKY